MAEEDGDAEDDEDEEDGELGRVDVLGYAQGEVWVDGLVSKKRRGAGKRPGHTYKW